MVFGGLVPPGQVDPHGGTQLGLNECVGEVHTDEGPILSHGEHQATTGANVSSRTSCRSPRVQYQALCLITCPIGARLRRNTHVPGRMVPWAWSVDTSSHVPFSSRLVISLVAAFFHSTSSESCRISS